MGNSLGFIMTHARRLKNRYNAQYRAIEFISKENRPSAPRYPNVPTKEIAADQSLFQDLQKKDLNLDVYLKEVYIQSYDKISEDCLGMRNSNARPLPESREARPNAKFIEPEEVEKGWCTLTQISEFLAKHEENPEENCVAAIAEKYGLEEKKVENTLKYFSAFRVFDKARDPIPWNSEEDKQTLVEAMEEVKASKEKFLEYDKSRKENVAKDGEKQEPSLSEHGEDSRSIETAIKN